MDAQTQDALTTDTVLSSDTNTNDAVTTGCGTGMTCPMGTVCVMDRCVVDRGPCMQSEDCSNDTRCESSVRRCVPFAMGESDTSCTREVRPGVFAPAVQCHFDQAPMGDPYPMHLHVLSTPMVADLRVYRSDPDAPARASIIAVFDDGEDGDIELPTGVLRILDGRTCTQQAVLTEQLVSHSSPPAVGDLDNDGVPEIVAFKAGGGLVAYRYQPATTDPDAGSADGGTAGRWIVWWRTSGTDGMPFNPTGGGWSGPSLADLDDDGFPEVLRHGMVFDGRTGRLRGGMSLRAAQAGYNNGAFAIVADVDEDNEPEYITGSGVYRWNSMSNDWTRESYYSRSGCTGNGCGEGHVAVADLGDFPLMSAMEAARPEIAVVSTGYVRIDTYEGRTVFGPIAIPGGGNGGPPTIADFDGDGLREIASAGATNYVVFDPDCAATPRPGGRCGTRTTNGILWSRTSQDASSNVTGSTSFDFEGDGRVEAVYADECFARVYDGSTGEVLFSQHHSSCTWYENPVVADVDGDLRAEIVVGSNFNCGSANAGRSCPGVGPRNTDTQFAGVRCAAATDCLSGQCSDGFCRCTMDAQCCPSSGECTYVCTTPPSGTPGTGNTCRAARPVGVRGLRVYSDLADRWVRSRPVWNQHAYSVTNISDTLQIPRSSTVARSWRDRTLNNFRTNVQGTADRMTSPDATAGAGMFECLASGGARLRVSACNRGTAPMPDGSTVAFYLGNPAMNAQRLCETSTPRMLAPGECTVVQCDWSTPPMERPAEVWVRVDDARTTLECRESNNTAMLASVVCRPPG